MPVSHFRLLLLVPPVLAMPDAAAAHDFPTGRPSEFSHRSLGPVGTWDSANHKEGCAMVRKSVPEISGRRHGLGLMFIQKLERQGGTTWVAMPVALMVPKEPKICQEGAG